MLNALYERPPFIADCIVDDCNFNHYGNGTVNFPGTYPGDYTKVNFPSPAVGRYIRLSPTDNTYFRYMSMRLGALGCPYEAETVAPTTTEQITTTEPITTTAEPLTTTEAGA